MVGQAFTNLSLSVRKHICLSSHMEHTQGDVETGERGGQEEVDAPEKPFIEGPQVTKAKNEFRRSLQKIFSETCWVDLIMKDIEYLEINS